METLYLEKLHLNAHLAAKQAYITQLETLLENKKNNRRNFMNGLKGKYASGNFGHFELEALADGRF